MKVKIEQCVKLKNDEPAEMFIPKKAHASDAGYDIKAACDVIVTLNPGDIVLVPAGFKMELEQGYEAQIRSRSGNALKLGLIVANSPGTIDAGYRGEVGVILHNAGSKKIIVHRGDKIAQMVFAKLPEIDIEISAVSEYSDRGEGGFGSTGK